MRYFSTTTKLGRQLEFIGLTLQFAERATGSGSQEQALRKELETLRNLYFQLTVDETGMRRVDSELEAQRGAVQLSVNTVLLAIEKYAARIGACSLSDIQTIQHRFGSPDIEIHQTTAILAGKVSSVPYEATRATEIVRADPKNTSNQWHIFTSVDLLLSLQLDEMFSVRDVIDRVEYGFEYGRNTSTAQQEEEYIDDDRALKHPTLDTLLLARGSVAQLVKSYAGAKRAKAKVEKDCDHFRIDVDQEQIMVEERLHSLYAERKRILTEIEIEKEVPAPRTRLGIASIGKGRTLKSVAAGEDFEMESRGVVLEIGQGSGRFIPPSA